MLSFVSHYLEEMMIGRRAVGVNKRGKLVVGLFEAEGDKSCDSPPRRGDTPR
jgi:hypothetical protein